MVEALAISGVLILFFSMCMAAPTGFFIGAALLFSAFLVQTHHETSAAPTVTLTGKDGSAAS